MNIERFVNMLEFASVHKLDARDLVVLYEVGSSPEGDASIMKFVANNTIMSGYTRHDHIKKLCARGFIAKKAVASNLRKKNLELTELAMEFLKQLEEIK